MAYELYQTLTPRGTHTNTHLSRWRAVAATPRLLTPSSSRPTIVRRRPKYQLGGDAGEGQDAIAAKEKSYLEPLRRQP